MTKHLQFGGKHFRTYSTEKTFTAKMGKGIEVKKSGFSRMQTIQSL